MPDALPSSVEITKVRQIEARPPVQSFDKITLFNSYFEMHGTETLLCDSAIRPRVCGLFLSKLKSRNSKKLLTVVKAGAIQILGFVKIQNFSKADQMFTSNSYVGATHLSIKSTLSWKANVPHNFHA